MWIILLALLGVVYLAGTIGAVSANFVDTDQSTDNRLIISNWWTQTTQSQFETGVLSNVDVTTNSGSAQLGLVSNPTLITSNNTEVYTTTAGAPWEIIKTVSFTKSDSSYNTLRIDSNLKSLNSYDTIYSSIRLYQTAETELFSHSTSSTTYVTYYDTFDFSSYANGTYYLRLYLQVPAGTGYNELFEVYKTSPTLTAADNTEVERTGIGELLMKTLTFTKYSSAYNILRFDTNLRSTKKNTTANMRITIDDTGSLINETTLWTKTTTSTTYVNYSDVLDFSGYANATYDVKLYLTIGNKLQSAYNSLFEIYRSSPELIAADNTAKSITYSNYQLLKTLEFTKSGTTYNEIRVDTNLHAESPDRADISIRVNDVERATHNTTSTTYVNYSDTIDISALTDGIYTVKIYLQATTGSKLAYNQLFEVYRTRTYPGSGTIASQVYDSEMSGSNWTALYWTKTLASGTDITFEVRASDTSFTKTDGTPTWVSLGSGDSPQTMSVTGRYFQWRATMTTSDNAVTPVLSDVTPYYPSIP